MDPVNVSGVTPKYNISSLIIVKVQQMYFIERDLKNNKKTHMEKNEWYTFLFFTLMILSD